MRVSLGRVLYGLAALVVVALGIWLMMPRAVLVETALVTKGRFTATVDEDGKTRIRERYVVAAPLPGRLTRVRLKAGDVVKADDVVATILPSPTPFLDERSRREAEEKLGGADATRARTKAGVDRAQAQAAQAKTDLDRVRTLAQKGVAAAQALEHAELAMRVAERDLRAAEFLDHAAEHDAAQAKALLAQYRDSGATPPERWDVAAPVSGLVLKVVQESETVVQSGTPILEIGDPQDLEIVIDVLSTDAVEIQPGADVAIEHWGGPGVLQGRVRRVEPAAFTKISTLGVEEQRVNVLVDVISPQKEWAGLGDAYQVDARITVFTADDAMIVPSGALFRSGDTWSVYIAKDGRAELRPVTLLRRSGRVAAISAGVQPGESVIVYPSDQIGPGVRIEAK